MNRQLYVGEEVKAGDLVADGDGNLIPVEAGDIGFKVGGDDLFSVFRPHECPTFNPWESPGILPEDDCDPPIPSDFPAGWQAIENGLIEAGDLLRFHIGGDKAWARTFVGHEIEQNEDMFTVYRKMEVCRNLDHDFPYVAPKALTDDDGKPPLARLPWEALKAVAQVQAYGHKKYANFNNYRQGMEISRNLSCAVRHIAEYMEGMDRDEESGHSHLAHAACRLLFTLQNIADNTAIDDRKL